MYGPVYELQPANPATLLSAKTAVMFESGSGVDSVFGALCIRFDHPRPEQRVRRRRAEDEQDGCVGAADDERVLPDVVEAALLEEVEERGFEPERRLRAGHPGDDRHADEEHPTGVPVDGVVVVAAAETLHAIGREVGVRVQAVRHDRQRAVRAHRLEDPARRPELAAIAVRGRVGRGTGRRAAGDDQQDGGEDPEASDLHQLWRPKATCRDRRNRRRRRTGRRAGRA